MHCLTDLGGDNSDERAGLDEASCASRGYCTGAYDDNSLADDVE
jgi:hypothetical protein